MRPTSKPARDSRLQFPYPELAGPPRRWLPALPTALAAALLAGASWAADAPQAPLYGETVEVRVVNVEAVVTDREGNRVLGLQPADFRLLVDGEEVPLEYFTEVRQGTAMQQAAELPAAGAAEAGQAVGTSYLLFIDDYFPLPRDRDRVLEALAEDVTFLRPVDRMAIVAFDGKAVDMLSNWQSSWPELQQALHQAQNRPAYGLHRLTELRQFTRATTTRRFVTVDGRLDIEEEQFATTLAEQTRRGIAGATAALRGFAQPPGRKVMLLLSGGWPFDPVNVATGDPARGFSERSIPRGNELYAPLIDTANQLGYTIYSVDVPGMEASIRNDVGITEPGRADFDGVRERERHSALDYVAHETGGDSYLNSQRLESLRLAATDTKSYYWLGFSPPRRGDDARHEVEVEVTRPGLRVRSREDFVDSSRSAEVTMAVESALLFGGGAAADGVIKVDVGEPKRSGFGRIRVPLSIEIPLDRVTVLPVGQGFQVALELRVAARDSAGSTADVSVLPLTLNAQQSPVAGQLGRFDTTIELRRADHDLVVAIFDPASGTLLTSPAKVDV